jgi:hypothetical protein
MYPVNHSFEGAHFHHMHINGSKSIGIFIPSEIHTSVLHNSANGDGMKEINKLALMWLVEQPTI